jgi:hypothetical protein
MHAVNRRRNRQGNMMILGCVFMSLIAALLTLGSSFGSLFFMYNRLQASANEVALEGARTLNAHDRVGQMNNMIGRCRQLVYSDSENYDAVVAHYPQLEQLALEMRDESIDNANLLESERLVLLNHARQTAIAAMEDKWDSIKGSYPIVLPWLKVSAPGGLDFRLGKIENTESNVVEFTAFPELFTHDRGQGSIRQPDNPANPAALSLYRQCINARLPAPNAGLTFKITSLAAPVQGTISPARIVRNPAFEPIPSGQIPSAAQVRLTLPVATGLGAQASSVLTAIGSAAATGADVQQ